MSEVRVSMTIDGQAHAFVMARDHLTVLEGAEAAGIEWPSQCQAGICGTCRARLLAGEVSMLENMVLDDDELARGYVLACQAVPVSDEVRLELDEW